MNVRFLLKDRLEGIGWFSFETLKRIVLAHPEISFHFLFDRPYDPSFIFASNVKPIVLAPQARHPILWHIWFQYSVRKYIQKVQPDLFISPDGFMSLGLKIPTLLVIHDIAFEHEPTHVGWLTGKYYRHYSKQFALAADSIVTVSEFSKQDIIKLYGIESSKISVVYNGVNDLFQPIQIKEQEEVRKKYTSSNAYFLYTGSIHPRKNLHNILRAFEIFKTKNNNSVKLLIVGRKAWQYGEVTKVYQSMKFRESVIFTGHIIPEELSKIMGAAIALVYTSFFEGFGIPIIEAMQSGTPVITSNISVMPETAGTAAVFVNPYEPQSIANAMERIHTDEQLRDKMIQLGLEHVKKYSWQKTSDALWAAVIPLLESCKQA